LKNLNAVLTAALLASFTAAMAFAQTASTPATKSAPSGAPTLPSVSTDSIPKVTVPADPFPKVDPKFFTASSPSSATVEAFLNQVWGFDNNRLWRVMAIETTPVPNISKVVVYVTSRSPDAKVQIASFFVTQDGKHAIEGSGMIDFGATPFAAVRDLLKQKATGAARGAASKDLLLVEFADLQCPYCKEAQATIDQIAKDFPKARIVFQQFPLVDKHPSAFKAAAYGVCAQKQSDETFFKYAAGVFDTQDALTSSTEDTLLRAAAQRAGLDGPSVAACSSLQETKDVVNADIKLATDAGVDQTPMLAVNGHLIPLGIPYEMIKRIIVYQAKLDGVETGAAANILAPEPPPQPTLNTLPK
jgi:protein-disulfide isomerase